METRSYWESEGTDGDREYYCFIDEIGIDRFYVYCEKCGSWDVIIESLKESWIDKLIIAGRPLLLILGIVFTLSVFCTIPGIIMLVFWWIYRDPSKLDREYDYKDPIFLCNNCGFTWEGLYKFFKANEPIPPKPKGDITYTEKDIPLGTRALAEEYKSKDSHFKFYLNDDGPAWDGATRDQRYLAKHPK